MLQTMHIQGTLLQEFSDNQDYTILWYAIADDQTPVEGRMFGSREEAFKTFDEEATKLPFSHVYYRLGLRCVNKIELVRWTTPESVDLIKEYTASI